MTCQEVTAVPRQSRISFLNYPHLVVAKANSGSLLFYHDSDYLFYLDVLRQLVRDRLLKVFAYCLLEHEVRLVVEPMRLKLSRIIQRLHGKHSARINRHHKRAGHLFHGRFRSLVFNHVDLLPVVRNVHLWPVREGLLRRPELYPYGSHASYLGSVKTDFLSVIEILNHFSGDIEAKKRAFGRYVEQSALEPDDFGITEIRPGIGGGAQSSQNLVAKIYQTPETRKKSSLKRLGERASLLLSITLEQMLSISRRQDLVMARRLLATVAVLGAERTVSEVAIFLHRDKAQISRLVTQGMDLLDSNEAFILMFDALKARGAAGDFYE